MIASPLVPNAGTKLIRKVDSSKIIERYRSELDFDVSKYFVGTHIEVRECEASGYQFYYPFSLVGDESLYRHLQQFDWNYKDTKWEYSRSAELLQRGSSVLDVGCGKGAFLAIASQRGMRTRGLELNASAADFARSAGLEVSTETVSDHAKANPERYDAVCSFQVLEHIPCVYRYIGDCIAALKPGGILVFGVPNNDGFLKYAEAVLNMPPHHMGLWTKKSLMALCGIFGLDVIAIETEPLQEIGWYLSVMERHFLKNELALRAYYKSGLSRLMKLIVIHRAEQIPGHTILAAFRKL
ncbi:MAG: hypothetical protein NVSMB58_37640 [Terriglobales bacterium]